MPAGAVLLVMDETTLRWFPPLRHVWAFRGQQAQVRITGQNAKRVLFGALNPRTGYRLILRRLQQRREDFQAFLHHLRRHYPGRPLWLLLDQHGAHRAAASRQLAVRLGIVLLWLPRQCPELNPVDHVWKELKGRMAANRQFKTIDEAADYAERWVFGLSRTETLRKAGVLSHDFWLKDYCRNFLQTYLGARKI